MQHTVSAFSFSIYSTHSLDLFLQMMYVVLCCYGIWDVGGAWHWLVVSQRKTIRAAARHGENGQVTHVMSISRQGMHHSHLTLVAGDAKESNMQATINAAENTVDPQAVLSLTKGIMHDSFNKTDSVCKFLANHTAPIVACYNCLRLHCLINQVFMVISSQKAIV